MERERLHDLQQKLMREKCFNNNQNDVDVLRREESGKVTSLHGSGGRLASLKVKEERSRSPRGDERMDVDDISSGTHNRLHQQQHHKTPPPSKWSLIDFFGELIFE